MIAKEELLLLKTKILPQGGDIVLDYLTSRNQQVELTHIVLENVPLLIIGRHGMIARIPVNGSVQKVSKADEILQQLRSFFNHQETLYLFVNLPDIPVPSEVTELLKEVQARDARKEALRKEIDEALLTRDKDAFIRATNALNQLMSERRMSASPNRRFSV
ncbi:IDEAL domain-containing protein [Alicyclobacillus curvatus]|nr:IDEAL domain-containing protein [Alicyclobacillus curvatus]